MKYNKSKYELAVSMVQKNVESTAAPRVSMALYFISLEAAS